MYLEKFKMLLLTLAACQRENYVGNKILYFLIKLFNQAGWEFRGKE